MDCAVLSTTAFNLIAVLTGVREIEAIWAARSSVTTPDAALQQALAISAFLMLYGAGLVAVGFWRRSGFPALAGAAPAGLHHPEDLSLRHAQPQRRATAW